MVVDRIEEGIAVIIDENGERYEIPAQELPKGACEGSGLLRTENGFELDPNDEERRREIIARTRRLIKHRPKD